MKKYIASTAISVSVTLPQGGNTRVSFAPLTDGTSVFYTDDKEIQWALEHHYKFGKLFRLIKEIEVQNAFDAKKTAKMRAKRTSGKSVKKTKTNTEEKSPIEEQEIAEGEVEIEEAEEGEKVMKEVTVSDMDAAKDYLAEHFDVVRTKLKTEEIIRETAFSYGIDFKFL